MRHTVFQQNIILTLIVETAGFFTVIFETEESQEGEFYRMSISFFKNNEIRLNTSGESLVQGNPSGGTSIKDQAEQQQQQQLQQMQDILNSMQANDNLAPEDVIIKTDGEYNTTVAELINSTDSKITKNKENFNGHKCVKIKKQKHKKENRKCKKIYRRNR